LLAIVGRNYAMRYQSITTALPQAKRDLSSE
jgi:hypothetical protein